VARRRDPEEEGSEAGHEFWVIDRGAREQRLLFAASEVEGAPKRVSGLVAFGDRLIFNAAGDDEGEELWSSDGTAAGTAQLSNAGSKNNDANIDMGALVHNGRRMFFAAQSAKGLEPWASNGTPSGTFLVSDIHKSGASRPLDFTLTKDVLFFTADDGERGRELWRMDVDSLSTSMAVDLLPQGTFYSLDIIGQLRDETILLEVSRPWALDGPPFAPGVYRHDIATGETALIDALPYPDPNTDVDEYDANSFLSHPSGDDMVFSFFTPESGWELWLTDGSEDGTFMLHDVVPGEGSSDARPLMWFGTNLYFTADDGVHGRALWVSDCAP